MARTFGKIYTNLWLRDEFRALAVDPQHLYMALATSPNLSHCGVHDYVPDRLSDLAADLTGRRIARTVALLEAQRYVIIDRRTGELFVRSFIRHDGILKSPNMTIAMAKAYRLVASPALRDAIVDELRRLWKEDRGRPGWPGLRAGDPELYTQVTDEPTEALFS